MAEIGFYHLTRMPLDKALPKLLGRVLEGGGRAMVLCGGAERVAALDAALWLSSDPDWLPHGTERTGNADLQPIWLTETDAPAAGAPSGARFLFLLHGCHDLHLLRDKFLCSQPGGYVSESRPHEIRTRRRTRTSCGGYA